MISSMDRLVDDIMIHILNALSVRAVLALRQTSRRYYLLSKLRCIWYARFCADVLARNLPLPGTPRPLPLLSAEELEQRTVRALYLERAWPRLSANTLVSSQYNSADSRVDQVMFIPGGMELLTVQGDKVVHWFIVGRPGFAPSLKYVGECTPFEGVPCRIVKDSEVPGVIAVGPREPWRSQHFVKVLSTTLEAPFVTLCNYPHVTGIVTGVWKHLLLLDSTRDLRRGGLELSDWHARTTGTALLHRAHDSFGNFLDYVVFTGHLVVVWERCITIFPIPHVPADSQIILEHTRAFMFQEAVARPVGFATCVARRVVPPSLIFNANLDKNMAWGMGWGWDEQHKQCTPTTPDMSPSLTIVARPKLKKSVSMVMLVPLADEGGQEKVTTTDAKPFPYRLMYLPPHLPSTMISPWQYGNPGGVPEDSEEGAGNEGDCVQGAFTTLCLGWSGRGIFIVGRELRLVGPELLVFPPFEMQFGPVFETGEALYLMDQQQWDSSQLHLDRSTNIAEGNADKVDFDEGMGRFVVAKGYGGFEVMQLDKRIAKGCEVYQ